jgi:hypothetical protein
MTLFNTNSRQLQLEKALDFMFAGKATFTVKSKKTGKHFTYKLSAPKVKNPTKEVHFVNLLTGSDNENNYSFFGTIFDKAVYKHGRKTRITPEAPGVVAFTWLLRNLQNGTVNDQVEIYHEGKCCRCGRKLTHPESIETGVGPECASRM